MAIGGTAMGNAAILAKQIGETVLGVDGKIYSPMKEALEGLGIYEGYSAQRLEKLSPDCVVIGNAVGRGNPEVEWFWRDKPFKFYSMPEYLYERVLKDRRTIAVCGTHGKTTTTALTAYLLKNNAAPVGWLVGGIPNPDDLPCGAFAGPKGGLFVIEGDEYDSAFFDKRAKFTLYRPTVAVLNNLEIDHTDIYRDIDDLKRAFSYMLRTIPSNGMIIANADDANLREIAKVGWVPTLWVSATDPKADLYIKDFADSENGSCFELVWRGKSWGKVSWGLNGLFNARNAAQAALAAGWSMYGDDPTKLSLAPLANFAGVKRRQQIRFKSDTLLAVEDFGHHPTAIALTLQSLRARFPHHRWVACMEPRSATSRSNTHQQTLPAALAQADWSLVLPVYHADALGNKALNTTQLVADIIALGKSARVLSSCDELPTALADIISQATTSAPIGIAFFTNGTMEGALDASLVKIEEAAHALV
jgi:UDP-N-acetylmuramate: L-alanyl-gamma-D-glutamyl-meso-diaminopimelate ligase